LPSLSTVRLEPWGSGDLSLLEQLMGDPAMTVHLGGPESHEKIVERQARYEQRSDFGAGQMFKIVDEATGEGRGRSATGSGPGRASRSTRSAGR
jgi:hypothetical protein